MTCVYTRKSWVIFLETDFNLRDKCVGYEIEDTTYVAVKQKEIL